MTNQELHLWRLQQHRAVVEAGRRDREDGVDGADFIPARTPSPAQPQAPAVPLAPLPDGEWYGEGDD